MRLLSLDRLVGPGRSLQDNFVLLCLEFIQAAAPLSTCRQEMSASRGFDILCEAEDGQRLAYKCMANSRYSRQFVSSLRKSIRTANKAFDRDPWDVYVLNIPFVPDADQRARLEGVLEDCKGTTTLIDGDEIETRLFKLSLVRSRFFPSVTATFPPRVRQPVLKTDDSARLLDISLESPLTRRRIAMRVGSDVPCGALTNFLAYLLKLPDHVTVSRQPALDQFSLFLEGESRQIIDQTFDEVRWKLLVVGASPSRLLEPDIVLEAANVRDDDSLRLGFETALVALYQVDADSLDAKAFEEQLGAVQLNSWIWPEEMIRITIPADLEGLRKEALSKWAVDGYVDWRVSSLERSLARLGYSDPLTPSRLSCWTS